METTVVFAGTCGYAAFCIPVKNVASVPVPALHAEFSSSRMPSGPACAESVFRPVHRPGHVIDSDQPFIAPDSKQGCTAYH